MSRTTVVVYDRRPSNPYTAWTEGIGFSSTRQTLLEPSARVGGGALGLVHSEARQAKAKAEIYRAHAEREELIRRRIYTRRHRLLDGSIPG